MSEYYNKRFKDEVLEQLLDKDGEPVLALDIIKRTTGDVVESDIVLKQKNAVIVNGDFINAGVMNNFNGKLNTHSEQIAMLMMVSELKDDIRSTGNDNLELFGISNAASIGILNNHSDFGVLKEDAVAGVTQIKMINASGYRYEKVMTNSLFNGVQLDDIVNYFILGKQLKNGKLAVAFSSGTYGQLVDLELETVIYKSFGGGTTLVSIVPELNMMCKKSTGNGNSASLVIWDTERDITFSASTNNGGRFFFFDEDEKRFYCLNYGSTAVNGTIYLGQSSIISENSTSFSFTNVRSISGWGWNDNYGTEPKTMTSIEDYAYKPKGVKAAYGIKNYRNLGVVVVCLENNYTTLDVYYPNFDNNEYITGVIKIGNNYIITSSNFIKRVPAKTDGTMDSSSNGDLISIPFLNGRTITGISEEKGIAFISGTDSLLGYSTDGINWTEIIMSDETMKNSKFSYPMLIDDGLAMLSLSGTTLTTKGITVFKSFNPESFKGKRYRLENEFITISEIELNSSDIIASLVSPLLNSHTGGTLIQRTTDSTIQPNSTQTVCVEMQNLYPHNAAVAIPIFTSLENVTVTAEICQRNENEIEEWLLFPFINSVVSINDWIKNTYFLIYPQHKDIFAMCFTVTNNNEDVVELFQLGIGLSDELYGV